MYELKVDNMTCGRCRTHVTEALKSVDPDAQVAIDPKTREVRVESACALPELTSALAGAGYPASPVSKAEATGARSI